MDQVESLTLAPNVVPKFSASASNSVGEYLDSTKDSPRCDANARFVPEVRKSYIGAQPRGQKSEQCSSSTKAEDCASSDEEANEVTGDAHVNTLRQKKSTSNGVQSKSSLLNVGVRELDERSQSPLPSHSARELAGSPKGSLPCTNVQELAEQREAENLEELRRLAADLDNRLELQIQKSRDQRSGPTSALFGPRVVRPASGSGPTSGFYEPQVVRSKLEKEVRRCGPTDNVLPIRTEREAPSVVRPVMEHDQQDNAYGNAVGANSNGLSATPDVSVMQSPTGGGQTILSPVPGQTQSGTQGDRRQVEGKSMSVVTEQPATVPLYRLVQVTPGGETMQLCSGIPQVSTSQILIEDKTPRDSKMEVDCSGTVYHTARSKRKDLRHTEEPLTAAELRTKERKTLQFESEDSEDADVSGEPQRRPVRKAKASAKVNMIQHSLRRSNGTSKRSVDPADAKVGQTQHSPAKKSNTSSRDLRRRTSSSTSGCSINRKRFKGYIYRGHRA